MANRGECDVIVKPVRKGFRDSWVHVFDWEAIMAGSSENLVRKLIHLQRYEPTESSDTSI